MTVVTRGPWNERCGLHTFVRRYWPDRDVHCVFAIKTAKHSALFTIKRTSLSVHAVPRR